MNESEEVSSRVEQLEVLGMMAAHEAAVADLYEAYARALPGHSRLFSELAEEEREHARLVAGFAEQVRKGLVQVKADRFSAEQVLQSLDLVREQTERARRGNVTRAAALGISAALEDGLVERGYLVSVEDDQPELRQLLQSLGSDTSEHRERLKQAWKGSEQ